jgi:uncharacterized damage-inducible protein DinB
MLRDYFVVFAHYNAWANRRLYRACEMLSSVEYLRERGSGYGSLHATLNQILLAERVWIARIEGRPPPDVTDGRVLYADLVALKIAGIAEDERLGQLVAGLTETALDFPLQYMDQDGNRSAARLCFVLANLFDAQSRCRGEASALLAQAGIRPPSLDFIAFVEEARVA